MTAPIPVRVTRHRCPYCPKSYSRPGRTLEHIARCKRNSDNRGCMTCRHFDDFDGCAVGVSLDGRDACTRCGGQNYVFTGEVWRPRFAKPGRVMAQCPECGGDGAEVKPGPIVHCEKWETVR